MKSVKHFYPDEIEELGYLVFGQPAKISNKHVANIIGNSNQ